MPIYEYRCESCGHQLEAMQKMSDPALTDCPECKKSTLQKLISAAGFHLKGGGWYATDFKGDKKSNGGSSSGGEKAASTDSAAPACGQGACPACTD